MRSFSYLQSDTDAVSFSVSRWFRPGLCVGREGRCCHLAAWDFSPYIVYYIVPSAAHTRSQNKKRNHHDLILRRLHLVADVI